MRTLFGGIALAVGMAVSIPGFAADIAKAPVAPLAPAFSWSGCYFGANVGWAWARQDASNPGSFAANQGAVSVSLDGNNVIGGLHAGCNWQFLPNWVLGAEGDWSATRLDQSATGPNLFFNGTPVGSGGLSFSRQVSWLASIRGRLGFVITPNIMLYGTGGGAFAHDSRANVNAFIGGCPNCAVWTDGGSPGGWVAGGGLEWAPWGNNWIVRAEYLYYQLPSKISTGSTSSIFIYDDLKIHEARVGLSYKFPVLGQH